MFVATKTLTVVEEAYEALAREKTPGESFSEVIIRLTSRRGSLKDCFGAWKISDEELARMQNLLGAGWKNFGRNSRAT